MKNTFTRRLAVAGVVSLVSIATSQPSGASTTAQASAAKPVSGNASGPTAKQANRALRKKIYAALAQHKEIDAGNISVTAKDGVVTLNGTVESAAQIEQVGSIAKGVSGVAAVKNQLTIQKPFGQ
ncbi:Transport-associated protein [Paraburkholderia piptadeniae]|uniref:Transport-associated protein n=1 Tax=Paraburkholderia piptadeniae TaxID=1701573 RepID=A0A1N7SQF8_9BURK|nr:BON domain-containing protein [Paraburkholderia piptadeniae]SIT49564.1 Transport-associated protein [Paraburkholderia piptadeniae]